MSAELGGLGGVRGYSEKDGEIGRIEKVGCREERRREERSLSRSRRLVRGKKEKDKKSMFHKNTSFEPGRDPRFSLPSSAQPRKGKKVISDETMVEWDGNAKEFDPSHALEWNDRGIRYRIWYIIYLLYIDTLRFWQSTRATRCRRPVRSLGLFVS